MSCKRLNELRMPLAGGEIDIFRPQRPVAFQPVDDFGNVGFREITDLYSDGWRKAD